MNIQGHAHIVGDNIDTDMIIPGRYLALHDSTQIAQHIFEGVDPTFVEKIQPGDILFAGRNFGCGSSREHAPIGLKALGLGCVVAAGFARIFYRNAINIGLPILISPEAVAAVHAGDMVQVDTDTGLVVVGGNTFTSVPLPPFMHDIMRAGGLAAWVRQELARRAADPVAG